RYGHSQKSCRDTDPVCEKCTESGHEINVCTSDIFKCINCSGSHAASSKSLRYQIHVDTDTRLYPIHLLDTFVSDTAGNRSIPLETELGRRQSGTDTSLFSSCNGFTSSEEVLLMMSRWLLF
ncbi:hypothetical protein AVEN_199187-1, partial [Araneus ventricosus]